MRSARASRPVARSLSSRFTTQLRTNIALNCEWYLACLRHAEARTSVAGASLSSLAARALLAVDAHGLQTARTAQDGVRLAAFALLGRPLLVLRRGGAQSSPRAVSARTPARRPRNRRALSSSASSYSSSPSPASAVAPARASCGHQARTQPLRQRCRACCRTGLGLLLLLLFLLFVSLSRKPPALLGLAARRLHRGLGSAARPRLLRLHRGRRGRSRLGSPLHAQIRACDGLICGGSARLCPKKRGAPGGQPKPAPLPARCGAFPSAPSKETAV